MTTQEIDRFTQIFTERECWRWQYHGVEIAKHPCDLMVYQAIIWEHRPNIIIECGSFQGGSGLFLAEQLADAVGGGAVVSIDITRPSKPPYHPRLEFVQSSSIDPAVRDRVEACIAARLPPVAPRVMVILDSDHTQAHVAAELQLWAPLVTAGQYLIVEDTCINGHPVLPGWGPGPYEALAAWRPEHPEFVVDRARERFLSTFNPGGYLLRV